MLIRVYGPIAERVLVRAHTHLTEEFLDCLVDIVVRVLELPDNRLGLVFEGHGERFGERRRGREWRRVFASSQFAVECCWKGLGGLEERTGIYYGRGQVVRDAMQKGLRLFYVSCSKRWIEKESNWMLCRSLEQEALGCCEGWKWFCWWGLEGQFWRRHGQADAGHRAHVGGVPLFLRIRKPEDCWCLHV